MDFEKVCQFMFEAQARGAETVLVTVGAVEGSSMRNPGTIMGVAEDGSYAGSLSGGCIESAVVAEALDALKSGEPRVMRFGAGSPYLDIKLPCGGGIDLAFHPLGVSVLAGDCLDSIRDRRPFSILTGPERVVHVDKWTAPQFDPTTGSSIFGHWPAPLLQIVGHGAGVEALASLMNELSKRSERKASSPVTCVARARPSYFIAIPGLRRFSCSTITIGRSN